MAYWLLKSEPSAYSIEDLRRAKVGSWDGVRSYQARNNLRAMRVGDLAFFYHSSVNPPGIAGVCRVVKESYPDHTQFDPASTYFDPTSTPEEPKWWMPDVEFVEAYPRLITLSELREVPGLDTMVLLSRQRLSVQPVADTEWKIIAAIAESL